MEQRDSGQRDKPIERLAFSVPEVAEMLGISRPTAYAYVRDGLIRAVVLRGRIVTSC